MKFNAILLVLVAGLAGYLLAARPAEAGISVSDSVARIAESLERIEQILKKCQ